MAFLLMSLTDHPSAQSSSSSTISSNSDGPLPAIRRLKINCDRLLDRCELALSSSTVDTPLSNAQLSQYIKACQDHIQQLQAYVDARPAEHDPFDLTAMKRRSAALHSKLALVLLSIKQYLFIVVFFSTLCLISSANLIITIILPLKRRVLTRFPCNCKPWLTKKIELALPCWGYFKSTCSANVSM
jgi:hypothetical protein